VGQVGPDSLNSSLLSGFITKFLKELKDNNSYAFRSPHSKPGLTIEHVKQVITDREKEIAREPKKVQFEKETAYAMGPVPALAANNGNIFLFHSNLAPLPF
jgi:hypothetical protein